MNKTTCEKSRGKNLNAQLEMIGLVIIVVIVITGLMIFLVYKLTTPNKNIQRAYVNNEITNNLLLSMSRVHVEECPEQTLGELIADCAKPYPERDCSDYTSCEIVNLTTKMILEDTLETWKMGYNFSIESPFQGIFINFVYNNCFSRIPGQVRGFALIPLYPLGKSAEIRLNICPSK